MTSGDPRHSRLLIRDPNKMIRMFLVRQSFVAPEKTGGEEGILPNKQGLYVEELHWIPACAGMTGPSR